ncbi:hypothetical protein LR68_00202 [Anoxybacillus sp. BCO1]|nr:hypothetical protein LR68_00202 [Anoxybacillus sp. BCO1]
MVKFTIQSLLIAVIFLVGVLLGMQQANEGMRKMKGYNDPSLERVIHVSKDETIVLGQSIERKKKNYNKLRHLTCFQRQDKNLRHSFIHSLNICFRLCKRQDNDPPFLHFALNIANVVAIIKASVFRKL